MKCWNVFLNVAAQLGYKDLVQIFSTLKVLKICCVSDQVIPCYFKRRVLIEASSEDLPMQRAHNRKQLRKKSMWDLAVYNLHNSPRGCRRVPKKWII